MQHPFEKLSTIWTAQELLDYAFRRAEQKGGSIASTISMIEKIKRKETNRIKNVSDILTEKIKFIIENFPNLNELPQFYRELSNILVDNDQLRLHLGQLNGVPPIISRLEEIYTKKVRHQETPKRCAQIRVEFFGRISSIIRKLKEPLAWLEESRIKLKKIPPINLSMPAVVVAGYPNVGKSSLVGLISTAKPEIAEYPFTTKQIYIGMYEDKTHSRYFQVIDTPGILDRPMSDRNQIEQQAISALNTVASIILYIFDPSFTSGYDIENQIRLYHEIKDKFLAGLSIQIKIIINKMDLAKEDEINKIISQLNVPKESIIFTETINGKNVDKVVQFLLTYFRDTNFKR